jgi:biotin-dependent carboxylase-like uncharacterized protein
VTALTVVTAGLQTTVQDLGRFGWAAAGVPVAGALDPAALAAANASLGNEAGAAGLECVLRGPTLVADADWSVAVVGAGWAHGPTPVAAGVPYPVGVVGRGLRCWVAVAGGLDTLPVLGSRSTDTLSRLGGFGGRALQAGDVLPLATPSGAATVGAKAGPALPEGEVTLRLTRGPHANRLTAPLDGAVFTVSRRSDRTAVLLDGDPLERAVGDIATVGVLPGAVQLPPDGQPIVLLGNAQTTGGYPVVGVVCSVDLRLVAQLRPGAAVRLRVIEIAEARDLTAEAAQAAD